MNVLLIAALLIVIAALIYYGYHELQVRWEIRRKHAALIARLESLPPVQADFSTPEGAVLCLDEACRSRNIEAAVACRDFAAEARIWLQQRHLSQQMKDEMLPKVTRTMEKSYRDSLAKEWPFDWARSKSYFEKHGRVADGVVAVSKVTRRPDGRLIWQEILVAKTNDGWRVVTHLPNHTDYVT